MPYVKRLLIVPYGIETGEGVGTRILQDLLIVPYGIETQTRRRQEDRQGYLLIVPYGIETKGKPAPTVIITHF